MSRIKILQSKKLKLLQHKLNGLQESFKNYTPHLKQSTFHNQGQTFKERLFLAGNRCGKTHAGAVEMAMHLTGLYPKWWQGKKFENAIQAWAASNTSESTRDILQKHI